MGKLARMTYMRYISVQWQNFYFISTRFRPFSFFFYLLWYPPLEWHIRYISPQRHMCRSSEWHMRYMWLHRYYLALIFGSDNGSVPVRRQVIILTNAGAQLIWPFGTNCIEIWILIQFSHTKMNSKMKCRKWRPFHLGFNALNMSISSMRCLYGSWWQTRALREKNLLVTGGLPSQRFNNELLSFSV